MYLIGKLVNMFLEAFEYFELSTFRYVEQKNNGGILMP